MITIFEGTDIEKEYPQKFHSVLEALTRERVFEVVQRDDGFEVKEMCDGWYWIFLSPEQLRLLGEEILALVGGGSE